ncbi:L,D-transpeptidase [Streptomyces sp. NBC_01136]|uniref:L,D-transpeptidase n=1 Tax=unclassified Streptomyces TaxID=2593676 RepID=UPI00324AD431|nr:L,D-transpeptidase [Streptomyces sp. NBC_01136]
MSDELASALREVAQDAETLPAVSGAEIRLLAVRRRRRRRTTVTVAGACAAAGLALVVALNLTGGGREDRPSPAATPSTPSAPPSTLAAPDATVDLARRVLTIAGRELPISSGSARYPTARGRMTVVMKNEVVAMPFDLTGLEGKYAQKVAWVIELRAADGASNFIAALTADEKAPGNYDITRRWIGLRPTDAKWLYGRLEAGAVIEIGGARATPGTAADAAPTATDGTGLVGSGGNSTGTSGGSAARTVVTPVPSGPSVTPVPSG